MNIKELYQSPSGKAIRTLLESTINSINIVTDIDKNLPPDMIAIEVLARIKAIEMMNNILQLTQPEDKSELHPNGNKKYGL